MSIISESTEISTADSSKSYACLHKKRHIIPKPNTKGLFTDLIDPILDSMNSYIMNIIETVSETKPTQKKTKTQNTFCFDPQLRFESEKETALNISLNEEKRIENEGAEEKETIDELICKKFLSLDKMDPIENEEKIGTEEYDSGMSVNDIVSCVFQFINRLKCLAQTIENNKICPSSFFSLCGKTYYILDQEMKDLIVRMTDQYDVRFLCKIFKTSPKSVIRWKKSGTDRKKGAGRKLIDPSMEKKLLRWFRSNMRRHVKISAKEFKEKALEYSSNKKFLASKGWFEKFKKKHNISSTCFSRKPRATIY